ncbi:MAG TPA: PepSY-associated TM helix domain-containing protein [Saprospiraceae bacterium]|nr:PepSY-associated TM helix domain-containing protein [Saprospiraceae bacterium]HNT19281.1 PepSY-associated TM helix domain-containing protein [Saprospiraceae bacterium]
MSENRLIQLQVRSLKLFRKIHRWTGISLFVFFTIVALTALILGWKKNTGELIMPATKKGSTAELKAWLPLDSLHKIACQALHDSVSGALSTELDRIDVRVDKGIAKFLFIERYWEIQLDGATGKILSIGKRYSDFFENVHDGLILDRYLGTSGEPIKLVYTTLMGLALLVFTITGFWLWYGPKRIRHHKHAQKTSLPHH